MDIRFWLLSTITAGTMNEYVILKSTTAEKMIDRLEVIFSRHSLPLTIRLWSTIQVQSVSGFLSGELNTPYQNNSKVDETNQIA